MPVCDTCGNIYATAEMRRRKNSPDWFCKDRGPCESRVVATENYDEYEIRTRKPHGIDAVEISYRKPGTGRFKKFTVEIGVGTRSGATRKEIEALAAELVRQHATLRVRPA